MKTMRLFSVVLGGLMVIVAIMLTVSGCGGKKEIVPVAVGEMEIYHDPVLGYNISYPKAGSRTWKPAAGRGSGVYRRRQSDSWTPPDRIQTAR